MVDHGRMKPSINVRPGRPADLAALLALEAQFPGDRLSPRQLRFHLMQTDGRLQVLTADGVLAGYVLILQRAGNRCARLYSLVVDAKQRGLGLGSRLLEAAEHAAYAARRCCLRLEVRTDNAAAISLYQARGYRLLGRRPRYYDDGADALRLEKALGPAPTGEPHP